ncbi:hypothetical protein PanWU01x14_104960, partial [Parasponia andersonii]
ISACSSRTCATSGAAGAGNRWGPRVAAADGMSDPMRQHLVHPVLRFNEKEPRQLNQSHISVVQSAPDFVPSSHVLRRV